jgi:hypothetical protein
MAIETQVVRFTKDATNVDGATQDVNLNFTPKAILVFSDGNTADNSVSAHFQWCQGFSDGTNHACNTIVSDDADAASDNCMSTRNDSVFVRLLEDFTTLSVESRATCAFATNKVTFTWVVNDAVATRITLVAYGGSDITHAKVNTVDIANAGTGLTDYTGLGFNPAGGGHSVLFTMGGFTTTTGEIDFAGTGFGAATDSIHRFWSGVLSENAADPTDTWRNQLNAQCFGVLNSIGGLNGWADFNSWITDGFRLDWEDATGATTYDLAYLVINGGTWDVGSVDSPASTGSQDTAVSVSDNTLRGLLTCGTGVVTPSTTASTINCITVGASDGTNESVIGMIDEDAQATSDSYRVNETTGNVIRLLTTNGANTAVAAFTSFGTNQFTLNWTTVASGATFGWVVVADQTSLTSITKQLTVKLNIQQEITKTNTLKFSILQEITKTLTTKLNILTSITKQLTIKLNILQEITKQLTTKLSILQEIIKQLTTRLDIIGRITETQTHKYNIIGRITTTKTHKYNVLVAITATKNHLYNVIGKVTRLRTHKYNVLQAITETNTHKYNIIGKITRLRTHKYNIIEQIEANKTHKYDVEPPEGTVTANRTHKYNLEGRVTTTKTHIYNVLDSIALSAIHKYHVLEQIERTRTHLYNVIGRIYTTKTHKYNVIRQITATKNHLYDILEGASEVTKNTTHVYNVLVRITNTLTHKYNVIGKATRLKTHKYNITGRIYKNGTYKFNIIQKITQIKTHKYNLLNRVTPDTTKTHKYNVLGKITRLRTHKYNIIGRIYRTRTHKYHMGGKLVVNRIHKYDVGSAVGLQELGGSTNAYIRFPERVRIIDIVSNIENVVVANIEIIVSRPPANKAVATVVIAEYVSSRLLTAQSTRLKHRIASLQILPPIIETIEQKAIAPHIAVEILPLSDKPQLQIQGRLQLANNRDTIHLQSLTQMKQDKKSIIKIASAIMLEQTQQTVIGSDSYVEIQPTPRPIIAPEIMTRRKMMTLKTLINLLSSDHLFE